MRSCRHLFSINLGVLSDLKTSTWNSTMTQLRSAGPKYRTWAHVNIFFYLSLEGSFLGALRLNKVRAAFYTVLLPFLK